MRDPSGKNTYTGIWKNPTGVYPNEKWTSAFLK
jgi:hypothetical protein